jgi:hypothetical protein
LNCVCGNSEHVEREVGVRAKFVAERTLAERACYSMRCEACNTRWCEPRLTDTQMRLLYTNYRSPEYDKMRERIEPDYAERKAHHLGFRDNTRSAEYMLQPYLKTPRILDVGGFDGLNTPLRHIATDHHVYDIEHGSPVEGATIVRLPDPPYDLVVMSHVLEHVPDPLEFLMDWAQHSSKMVYVEVPHSDIAKQPSHWHEHLTMFTVAGMALMIKRARLSLLDLKVKNRAILAVARVPASKR